MRRVVIHEVVLAAGAALLVTAALTTGAAQHSLNDHLDHAVAARMARDSLAPGSVAFVGAARRLEEAEFNVRATRELRARLWRPGGMAMTTAVVGIALVGVGVLLVRRRTDPP